MMAEKEDVEELERKLQWLRTERPQYDFYRDDNAVYLRDWDKQRDFIIFSRLMAGTVVFAVMKDGHTLSLPFPVHTTPLPPKFKVGEQARYTDGRIGRVESLTLLPGLRDILPSWRISVRVGGFGWLEAGEQYFEKVSAA